MPAVTAASTRNNVHAVFSTCVAATTVVDEQENNEEIQFHMEDYYSPSIHDNGDAVSVSVDETTLSNMWAALDDFDSFSIQIKCQRGKPLAHQLKQDLSTGPHLLKVLQTHTTRKYLPY